MLLLDRLPTGSRHPSGCPSVFVSSPTRIRTWNAWLEARNDHPFHHQAISGRQGNRTLITQLVNLLSRQTQRTSIWLPSVCVLVGVTENRIRRVSTRQGRHAIAVSSRWTITPIHSVDRRGIEPRLPDCKSGVFPLDEQPVFQLSCKPRNRTGSPTL